MSAHPSEATDPMEKKPVISNGGSRATPAGMILNSAHFEFVKTEPMPAEVVAPLKSGGQ